MVSHQPCHLLTAAFEQALIVASAEQAAEAGSTSAATAVIGTAAAATGVGMTVAGFTTSGITAGSIAAGVQAAIGNVSVGSAFAGLQSFAAVGGFATMTVIGFGMLFLSLVGW